MQYLVARDGQQLGQFSEEEIQSGLFEGRYLPTDSAWTEGMDDWKPLGEIMGQGLTRIAGPRPASVAPVPKPEAARSTGIAIAALVFVGVAVAATLSIGALGNKREKEAMASGQATAGKMAAAVRAHAATVGGQFPATLDELVTAGTIGQDVLELTKAYKPPGWQGEAGFDYHGAGLTESTAGEKPLLTSRCWDAKGRRLVVTSDRRLKLTDPPAK